MTPPGIKDVALHAGVSVGTVSNVLNRPDLVSDRTRQRVLASIATLGYVRNESARQLRTGCSRIIACVVLDMGNPFFADVARGAEEAARDGRHGAVALQQRARTRRGRSSISTSCWSSGCAAC